MNVSEGDYRLPSKENRYDYLITEAAQKYDVDVDLIRAVSQAHSSTPLLLLTDDSRSTGHDALEAGAVDYLVRQGLTPGLLERAFRYSIAQSRSAQALRTSEARFRAVFR